MGNCPWWPAGAPQPHTHEAHHLRKRESPWPLRRLRQWRPPSGRANSCSPRRTKLATSPSRVWTRSMPLTRSSRGFPRAAQPDPHRRVSMGRTFVQTIAFGSRIAWRSRSLRVEDRASVAILAQGLSRSLGVEDRLAIFGSMGLEWLCMPSGNPQHFGTSPALSALVACGLCRPAAPDIKPPAPVDGSQVRLAPAFLIECIDHLVAAVRIRFYFEGDMAHSSADYGSPASVPAGAPTRLARPDAGWIS